MNPPDHLPMTSGGGFRRFCLKLLAAACLIGLFTEWLGIPHLRVSYTYIPAGQARIYTSANYWTPMGTKHVHAGDYGRGCPLILLIPMERTFSGQAADWLRSQIEKLSNE